MTNYSLERKRIQKTKIVMSYFNSPPSTFRNPVHGPRPNVWSQLILRVSSVYDILVAVCWQLWRL